MKAGPATTLAARQQHTVPEAIRALSTIREPDYIDLFTIETAGAPAGSPEQWARAAMEDVLGLRGQFAWRILLGLRLKWRAAPHRIAGWTIADRGDGWLRLHADSWLLTAQLVFHVDDHRVSTATMIRYNRPVASRVWQRVSVTHRRALPHVLREAHRLGCAGWPCGAGEASLRSNHG